MTAASRLSSDLTEEMLAMGQAARAAAARLRDTTADLRTRAIREMARQIRQDAVLLQPGRDNPAAQALMLWLTQEPTKRALQIYGYGHAD